jgi:hypothetical protein
VLQHTAEKQARPLGAPTNSSFEVNCKPLFGSLSRMSIWLLLLLLFLLFSFYSKLVTNNHQFWETLLAQICRRKFKTITQAILEQCVRTNGGEKRCWFISAWKAWNYFKRNLLILLRLYQNILNPFTVV